MLLPAGCGAVAADVIGAEPARPGSPVTACDFAFIRSLRFLEFHVKRVDAFWQIISPNVQYAE